MRTVLRLVVLVLSLLLPCAHPAAALARTEAWGWPLAGEAPPQVVRAFAPPPRPWLAGHRGVDLAAPPGAEVRAAGAGRVAFAGSVAGTPVITVAHGALRTTYLPVQPAVRRGDRVGVGDVLGTLAGPPGSTAHCAPRSCLHWGLLRGREYLDPLALLGRGEVRLLPVATGPGCGPDTVVQARGCAWS
ncbi:murein hydrolase activator EnvC family protein [Marinactinospora rubrisoli]|uniref:Murein hydrolase activator EnvC family protein n=1 Tax=Marinactinospora rubrisoli TaxID=2715399 RepID=A0ABW2KCU1_9ACTN